MLSQPVTVRRSDFRIRVSDILQASRQPHTRVSNIRREFRGSFDIVHDFNYRGTYVDFWVAVELCRRYGLTKLEEELRSWKGVPQEPVKEPELSEPMKEPVREPIKEPELSELIEITGFPSPVMVRRSDFRVNASHIAKLIDYPRTAVANLRDGLNTEVYEILRGNRKRQGTYVNFDVGIGLCRDHGLPELEKRLYSLKRTSEGPVLEAEPSHVRPHPPEFDTVSARNESTPSTGIPNRDQPPTLPGGPISNGPIEAEDENEMDSGSDVAGSGDSATSRESCLIQRNLQPVPSIHRAKDATSSRQSGRDIKYSLLELADPHSLCAKSVQYEVWNSRPQLSELTEVNPELRPSSWETASHYGSLSDLYDWRSVPGESGAAG